MTRSAVKPSPVPASTDRRNQPTQLPTPTIGVFDSGIGGLSVLRELRMQLPFTPMHYVADSAYAPYGERGDAYVAERSLRVARHLVASGASVIVVACNTATAAAVQILRSTWPTHSVVGVEPGIKPAMAATRNGRIGVLATPGTLASEKFDRLMHSQVSNAKVLLQPCPGLAALIERSDFESAEIHAAVHEFCRPLISGKVDTVVLGCTHYAFIRASIEREMGPNVHIVDTAEAVARRAAHLYSAIQDDRTREARLASIGSIGSLGSLRVETTGDPDAMRRMVASITNQTVMAAHVDLD